MGEQVGKVVAATLYYVPLEEFARVRSFTVGHRAECTSLFADMCRLNTIYMIAGAGSGHIGSSFSSLDIVSHLYLNELGADDVYFSSKGHDAPGLYAVLTALQRLPFEKSHALRRLSGLPGHPDVSLPGMAVNSGSLGQGISKAKGMVHADRLDGRKRRYFVLTGDGELQEGQIWESLVSAANARMGEITVIVDHNKLQSDYAVARTSDLGDLEAKFASFGWQVHRCNGHDINALSATFAACKAVEAQPKVIIADTIKGRGISFMEHTAMESDAAMYRFHSGAPDSASYATAVQELVDRINAQLAALGTPALTLESRQPAKIVQSDLPVQRMIPAYTRALLFEAERNPRIVALDADLILDTGLIPFRDTFGNRFIECGIAEQDMVGQAGGLALKGYLPIVHSFASFLGSRANEQIFTNATERTKIVYVGSLAGLLPGGPGHSHQSVRDISALAGMPGMLLAEPCCETEVAPLLDYLVNRHTGPSYMRLVSIPCAVPFQLPDNYAIESGRGSILRDGREAVVIGYGPVLLPQAWHALDELERTSGRRLKLVALPWLNRVDENWLRATVAGASVVFALDNHFVKGGQGELIGTTLAKMSGTSRPRLVQIGVQDIPVCGANAEVLAHHLLDAAALSAAFARHLA